MARSIFSEKMGSAVVRSGALETGEYLTNWRPAGTTQRSGIGGVSNFSARDTVRARLRNNSGFEHENSFVVTGKKHPGPSCN